MRATDGGLCGVSQDFIDPALGNAQFHYTDPKKSWDSKWWGGEPMWSTAVKNGLRAMNCMWPGPPKMKDGTKPTVWFPFQNRVSARLSVKSP